MTCWRISQAKFAKDESSGGLACCRPWNVIED